MTIEHLKRTNLSSLKFAVVDVETTGMNSRYNRVTDIGIVIVSKGKVGKTWTTLVNPKQEIDPWVAKYTHISQKMVDKEKPFSHYSQTVAGLLRETIFVAHNVDFDYGFIKSELKNSDIAIECPKLCTVKLARKLLPQMQNVHLDALSTFYGIKISRRHRALPDALATAEILLKFISLAGERYKAETFFGLERLQHIHIPRPNNDEPISFTYPLFS